MSWLYFFYTNMLVLIGALMTALAVNLWWKRRAPEARPLALLMLSTAFWSAMYALELVAPELQIKLLGAKLKYVGIVMLPTAGLLFALRYTRRERRLKPHHVILLGLGTLAPLLFVLTNDAHQLFWSYEKLGETGAFSALDLSPAIGFWVFAAYSRLLIVFAVIMFIGAFIRSRDVYRKQAGILIAAILAPFATNAIYLVGLSPLPGLDLVPFGLVITCLLCSWAIFRLGLADIIPTAHAAVIRGIGDSVIVLDRQNRILEMNPAAQRLAGATAAETFGRPLEEALPELTDQLDPSLHEMAAVKEVTLGAKGSTRIYDVRLSPLTDQGGYQVGKVLVLRDITEHRQAEEKAREQNRFLENVLESLTHPFYVIDVEDYSVRLANSAAKIGKSSEYPTCYSLTHNSDLPCGSVGHACPIKQVKKTKGPAMIEHTHFEEDGTPKYFQVHGYPILDENENVAQMISYHLDVTNRRRMEEALRESEARLRTAIESLPFDFFVIGEDGRYVMQNSACRKRWGNVIGKRPEDLDVDEDNLAIWKRNNERALSGKVVEEEVRLTVGGEEGFYHTIVSPIMDQGKALGILGVNIDITDRKRMEEELRASEERYRNIFENIQDVYGEVALDGTILELSPSIERVGGYTREELLGKSILDYHLNPESRADVIDELLQTGRVYDWEFLLRHKDGHVITFSFNVVLVTDDDGVPIKTVGVMRDMTNRKRLEEELISHRERLAELVKERTSELREANAQLQREIAERKQVADELQRSHERHRRVLNACHDMITVIDENGDLLFANEAVHENTGYTLEDIESMDGFDTIHAGDRERIARWFLKVLNGEPARGIEYRGIHKDGETRWVESNADSIYWDRGQRAVVNVLRDITERKQAEEARRESEEKYRNLFENSIEGIFTMDIEGNFTSCNPALEQVLGLPADKIVGRSYKKIVAPEAAEILFSEYNNLFLTGAPIRNLRYETVRNSGERRTVESNVSLITKAGEPAGFQGTSRDITEQVRAEGALIESEERYRTLVASSLTAIYVIQDGNFKFVNDRLAEVSGYTRDELMEMLFIDLVHPDDRDRIAETTAERFRGEPSEGQSQFRAIGKSGNIMWLEACSIRINYKERPALLVNLVDITEQKAKGEALRESEERLRALLNACTDTALFLIDKEGAFLALNETLAQRLGKSVEELIGTSLYDIPDPEVMKERKVKIDSVFRSGKPLRFEDERVGIVFDNNLYPILDRHGKVSQMAIYGRDITERRRAERQLQETLDELEHRVEQRTAELSGTNKMLEEEIAERKRANAELRQKNKQLMELEQLKDDLMNMVVHDMKNPVTNSMLGLDLIVADRGGRLTKQQKGHFHLVKRNQHRLSEMIANLLELSRLESDRVEVERIELDMLDAVNQIVENYTAAEEMQEKTIEVAVDDGARKAFTDKHLLERILSNVLSNAIKHSYPGGKINGSSPEFVGKKKG